ncbi:MAG: S8 family serine peptidase [Candidatus Hydrogenedentes bacterium]|nr:S8 family serine peptidase [Candidatus Hydrogenedentota bacterium]
MATKSKAAFGYVTKAGYLNQKVEPPKYADYVIAELRYDKPIAYEASAFKAPAAAKKEADNLNQVLSHFDIANMGSLFGLGAAKVSKRVELAASLPSLPSGSTVEKRGGDPAFFQSNFVCIVPKCPSDAKRLAAALGKSEAVWGAYVAPRPVPAAATTGPASGSRNFEPSQGYLHSAPNGIGAMQVWDLAGAKGKGVTICDIEGAWNREHEDLPAGISLIGGDMLNDLGWRDHGTAVLGEMVARPNTFGAVGAAHEAKAVVHSAFFNQVFNLAGALSNAASKLKAGDVILIELQSTGPNGKYVAMQYWNDIFTAIKTAVSKGITVVEAAGNGDENFDLAIFKDTGLQKDSGAIVVGAGVPPTNYFDNANGYATIGAPRSRIWFSNYGNIVNVQAWGWHVTTLGYGDAQGGSEKSWYTLRFSGTSSASPIVTAAAACLQGRAKAKNGTPLTPAKLREILIKTGTPQEPGPGVPLSQKIGPQPNLASAMAKV